MRKTAVLALGLVLALGTTGRGRAAEYQIDPVHSNILFKVKHLGISTVMGKFDKFEGNFSFDEKNPKGDQVDVSIDTTSVDTQNDRRDTHLNSADFFEVDKYPTAKFTAKKASAMKDGKFQLTGNLTLHGVTKPVVLDVEYSGAVTDKMMGQRVAFTATTEINRQDFGVKFNKVLDNGGAVVSDRVKLELDIEGVVKKADDDKK